jgi:hypothetical protein
MGLFCLGIPGPATYSTIPARPATNGVASTGKPFRKRPRIRSRHLH